MILNLSTVNILHQPLSFHQFVQGLTMTDWLEVQIIIQISEIM